MPQIKTTWFTADTHFGHSRLAGYRGYMDIDQHDSMLIDNWNSCVGKNHRVYHLGDFGFASTIRLDEILSALNGEIHLLIGNHDRKIVETKIAKRFVWCKHISSLKFNVGTNRYYTELCHYPISSWNKKYYGAIHLHGHSHGTHRRRPQELIYDVGVDATGYCPIQLDMILDFFREERDGAFL